MFETMDAARDALDAAFDGAAVETLLAALRPVIALAAGDDTGLAAIGATRIGGLPDLPPDQAWPIRAVPADLEQIMSLGGSAHGDHIRKHLEKPLPYSFVAQIDLAEAAALGEVADLLPGEGRLLFFYDAAVAPWRSGPESCHVIWDRSPAQALVRKSRPEALTMIGADSVEEWNEIARTSGFALASIEKTAYWGPPRAVTLARRLQLPDQTSIEAQNSPALEALLENDDVAEAYSDFVRDGSDKIFLLGAPVAEQDDPRYDAVVVADYGAQFLSHDQWLTERERIMAAARDWRLLLQLDLEEYLQQDYTEGTAYFLIRHDDLTARRFDRTVVIYQQT